MKRTDFRFFHRLRVRWAEVDMQKIVFNAHYLMYFDTAVTDYWRALALPYQEAMHQLGGDLYVKKATVEFHASARMDDLIDVGMKCARIGNSSLTFSGAGDGTLISGVAPDDEISQPHDRTGVSVKAAPATVSGIVLDHDPGEIGDGFAPRGVETATYPVEVVVCQTVSLSSDVIGNGNILSDESPPVIEASGIALLGAVITYGHLIDRDRTESGGIVEPSTRAEGADNIAGDIPTDEHVDQFHKSTITLEIEAAAVTSGHVILDVHSDEAH